MGVMFRKRERKKRIIEVNKVCFIFLKFSYYIKGCRCLFFNFISFFYNWLKIERKEIIILIVILFN